MMRFTSCCLFFVLLLFHMFAATVPLLLPHRAGLVFAAQRVIVPVDHPHCENYSQILKQALQPFRAVLTTFRQLKKLENFLN